MQTIPNLILKGSSSGLPMFWELVSENLELQTHRESAGKSNLCQQAATAAATASEMLVSRMPIMRQRPYLNLIYFRWQRQLFFLSLRITYTHTQSYAKCWQ